MIISRNLIADFLPSVKELPVDKLILDLFNIGIEVEKFETIVSPSGLYYGVIEKITKISGSRKLKLCQVFIPIKNERFEIVCGAENIEEKLKVLVALPGAKLLNNSLEIGIRKFTEANITSNGMICGYGELFVSDILKSISTFEKGQVIVFGNSWDINRHFDPSDLWLDDVILNLSIPANRGDLHSAWGISRELAKLWSEPLDKLSHGAKYKKEDDMWLLKRVLLTNNMSEKIENDFEVNLNKYAYLAFNESLKKESLLIKKKHDYFQKLCKSFLTGSAVTEFEYRKVPGNVSRLSDFLGFDISEICKSMQDNPFFKFKGDYFLIPEWRYDVNDERDLISELLLFVNCNEIKSKPIPILFSSNIKNSHIRAIEKIREFWRNWGAYECITFNLNKFNSSNVSVENPISRDHIYLRNNAISELISVLDQNFRSKRDLYPVFEIFERNSNIHSPEWTLNIASACRTEDKLLEFPINKTKISFDLCDIQALIKKSMKYLNIDVDFSLCSKDISEEDVPTFNSDDYWSIRDLNTGKEIGWMGYMNTNLPMKVSVAFVKLPRYVIRNKQIPNPPKYIPSYQDISIEIPEQSQIYISEILNSLKSKNLVEAKLIDVQRNSRYLIRCKFQSLQGTMTKNEIHDNMAEIYSVINKLSLNMR